MFNIEIDLKNFISVLWLALKKVFANSNPISISFIRFGRALPRRFVLKRVIDDAEANLLDHETFSNDYQKINDSEKEWVNSCELNFRINNIHPSKSLSILGIYFDYKVFRPGKVSSFLEIPQGDYGMGEAVCLACCFTGSNLIRQRYKIIDHQIRLLGDMDYFEGSTIDIAPSKSLNLNLSLISNNQSIIISHINLIYILEENKAKQIRRRFEVPLENPIVVYALKDIPANQRYRLTWRPNPPIVTLESDDSVLPSDEVECRWDNFPNKF